MYIEALKIHDEDPCNNNLVTQNCKLTKPAYLTSPHPHQPRKVCLHVTPRRRYVLFVGAREQLGRVPNYMLQYGGPAASGCLHGNNSAPMAAANGEGCSGPHNYIRRMWRMVCCLAV